MTKEELINFGEMFLEVNEDSRNSNIYEFIEKALKLLKQETVSRETYESEYLARKQAEYELWKIKEQQPSDDCVSRQAVLEKINDWWGITLTSGEPTLCDCIRELPSVAPTRKVGKWIYYIDEQGWSMTYPVKCSNCNTKFTWSNYCPHCGAEMESENKKNCNNCTHHTDANEIHGITPCGSCGMDLKNFKQKTEMKDTYEQEKNNKESIPYLMHKEMDIPLLECQKAYDVAMEYLRSQAKVKG